MPELTPEHRKFLAAHAVDPDFALSLGVRSALGPGDLGDDEKAGIGRHLPEHSGILFPWTSIDGRKNVQLRPDEDKRPRDKAGEPIRYIYQPGRPSVLWAVREVENPVGVILAEGSKQCLVAARYAPEGWSVYGLAGCWGFSHEGSAIPDLEVVDGLPVKVILDADFATNFKVWGAADRLRAALKAEGSDLIEWVRLPAGGKAGLDDYLAKRGHDRRARVLGNLLSEATAKFPAKPKPGKPRAGAPVKLPTSTGDRVVVVVNEDRFAVINDLTTALVDRFSGRSMFSHGGVISELKDSKMHPVDRGRFNNVLTQATRTVFKSEGTGGATYADNWPDANTMTAVLANAEKFTPLDRVALTPFVRPDGSVCTTPGYDEATRSILVPDEALGKVEVPDQPTAADIEAARDLLLVEWLGDFPFETTADRANMLGLLLTPFIRALVPLVPLAVIDGTGMGVGKNLLADCLSILFTGQGDAKPMPYTKDDEEHRKVITSAFREGSSLFFFDEAHEIEGANFARAITSVTYQDRILGVSRMAEFPNRVTWVSMGNNVKVQGDMTRRVYRIRIDPKSANPQDRPSSSFRHPGVSGLDLKSWTGAHRAELLRAALVLVRGWYAHGKVRTPRAESFGSFETWEEIVLGVCALAGVPDFLGNLKVWRGTSDFKTSYWTAHLEWLYGQFGNRLFKAADVKNKAQTDPASFEPPPENEDTSSKGFSRVLGQQYASLAGQWYDGLQVVRTGGGKGGRINWAIEGSPQISESERSERSEGYSSESQGIFTPHPHRGVEGNTRGVEGDTRIHGRRGLEPSDRSDRSDPPTPRPEAGEHDPDLPTSVACSECGEPTPFAHLS